MSAEKENVKDTLGQRMKEYEKIWNSRVLDLTKPIYARIDGRHFSSLTKNFGYPYSDLNDYPLEKRHNKFYGDGFFKLMQNVAKALLDEFDADIVETHSDEISLGWLDGHKIPFHGEYFKLVSNMASYASSIFMKFVWEDVYRESRDEEYGADYASMVIAEHGLIPSFDCRILNVPDVVELTNCFVWRQNDCVRGTINQYAQCWFSHNELHGKTINDRLQMLENAGHGNYLKSDEFEKIKLGSFFKKKTVVLPIEEKYKKYNPNKTTMIRSQIVQIYPGRLAPIVNKTECLFGEDDK